MEQWQDVVLRAWTYSSSSLLIAMAKGESAGAAALAASAAAAPCCRAARGTWLSAVPRRLLSKWNKMAGDGVREVVIGVNGEQAWVRTQERSQEHHQCS